MGVTDGSDYDTTCRQLGPAPSNKGISVKTSYALYLDYAYVAVTNGDDMNVAMHLGISSRF